MTMKIPTVAYETISHHQAGALVRERRLETGISLRAFAKQLEISPSYLSDLERGRRNWSESFWTAAMQWLGAPPTNQPQTQPNK